MKKRIILLIFMILFLTGCSVNYELKIDNDEIIETMILTQQENGIYTNESIYSSFNDEYPIFKDQEFLYYAPSEKLEGNTYYKKTINESNGTYTAKYVANFDIDDYSRSRILDTAYKYYSTGYNSKDKAYYITANNLKIFNNNKNIDNISVTINLEGYEIVDSNYHTKNNNSYTWNFNRGDDGTLDIKFKKKNNEEITQKNDDNQNESKRDYSSFILAGILLLLFIIGYIAYKIITRDNESID